MYSQFFTFFELIMFIGVALAYGSIWVTISRTSKLMGSDINRYQNSAKVMMVFVIVFILQWWSLALFNIWSLITPPPAVLLVLPVALINLGGVYNCIAYTVIRRRLRQQAAAQGPKVVVGRMEAAKSTATVDTNLEGV